jgi:hypothetical protein
MKSLIFWDLKPCNPLKVNAFLVAVFVLIEFLAYFHSWRWRQYITPNRQFTYNGLLDIILDSLCGLKVKVSGYKFRGPGSNQISWQIMGLDRPREYNFEAVWKKK